MKNIVTVSAFLSLLLSHHICAATAKIAVASNFASPMKQIVQAFEIETPYQVLVSYGSSGKFFAQIQNGAPFDVFLSADSDKPIALEKANFAVADSRFTYAVGRLALWTTKPNDDVNTRLKLGRYEKIALANPKLAPYGVATVEVLRQLELKDSSAEQWVMGENISQTFQFVASGNADLGFVSLSQIMKNNEIISGSGWVIPDTLHAPINQDAVLLTKGKSNDAAKAFIRFLQTKKSHNIIAQYGYAIPKQIMAEMVN